MLLAKLELRALTPFAFTVATLLASLFKLAVSDQAAGADHARANPTAAIVIFARIVHPSAELEIPLGKPIPAFLGSSGIVTDRPL
jgi:hypothetical protein